MTAHWIVEQQTGRRRIEMRWSTAVDTSPRRSSASTSLGGSSNSRYAPIPVA